MLSPGIILDNTHNYGIVKTETLIGFGPNRNSFMNMSTSEPFEWLFTHGDFGRSFTGKNYAYIHSKFETFNAMTMKTI